MACKSTGEKVFTVVNITLLVLLCVCFLLPMFIVLMQSFLSQDEISRRGTFILIPEVFDTAAYRMILSKGSSIFNAYGVTIMRVAAGTAQQVMQVENSITGQFLSGRRFIAAPAVRRTPTG